MYENESLLNNIGQLDKKRICWYFCIVRNWWWLTVTESQEGCWVTLSLATAIKHVILFLKNLELGFCEVEPLAPRLARCHECCPTNTVPRDSGVILLALLHTLNSVPSKCFLFLSLDKNKWSGSGEAFESQSECVFASRWDTSCLKDAFQPQSADRDPPRTERKMLSWDGLPFGWPDGTSWLVVLALPPLVLSAVALLGKPWSPASVVGLSAARKKIVPF